MATSAAVMGLRWREMLSAREGPSSEGSRFPELGGPPLRSIEERSSRRLSRVSLRMSELTSEAITCSRRACGQSQGDTITRHLRGSFCHQLIYLSRSLSVIDLSSRL